MTKEQFAAVVRELELSLGGFVAQMIADPMVAEEVLQETFYVAWRERGRMPSDHSARRAWMYGVARNQALHALRKTRRGQRAAAAAAAVSAVADEGPNEALAMRDLLARVLPPEDRSLFVLRYVHGFTAAALADMTGIRAATVRKRLERSAGALREQMTHHIQEEVQREPGRVLP